MSDKNMPLPNLSIVLPCYNEKDNLSSLVDSYLSALGDRNDAEIIFVDNGSNDGTSDKLKEILILKNDRRLRTAVVEINQGYGFGILSGLKVANGKYLAWSHADQQCAPEDVFNVYETVLASKKPENVFGKGHRVNDRGRAAILTLIQEFLAQIILGIKMTEINAQPKVFHRSLFERFQIPPKGYELDIYAYYKALTLNFDVVAKEVIFHDRKHGQSKWSFSLTSKIKQILRNFNYLVFLRLNRKIL